MTDQTGRPWTEDDLRAHAARLHAGAARDPDERIRPTVQRRWGSELDVDQIDEVCDEVTGLLDRTVNVSRWAVDLGADGLVPDEAHVDIAEGGRIGVRIHFAFHPDMPQEMRASAIAAVREETAACGADPEDAYTGHVVDYASGSPRCVDDCPGCAPA